MSVRLPARARTWIVLVVACVLPGCGGDAIGGPPEEGVASVEISGAPTQNGFYEGHYITLTAARYDEDGARLPGGSFSWTSSDPGVAEVGQQKDSMIAILGKSEGSAVITVESSRRRASLEVDVVPAPSPYFRIMPDSATVYLNATSQLRLAATDSFFKPISDLDVSWTSSNPEAVTVDSRGIVKALAIDTATIFASAPGRLSSASVQVRERPSADWSGATEEWSTYQGNSGHTGYVDATLDPVIFAPLWTTTLEESFIVPQAVAGGGRIFITSGKGHRNLVSLDAATGAEVWSHDFGDVEASPPTYDEGRVYVLTGGLSASRLWSFDAVSGAVLFQSADVSRLATRLAPVVAGGGVYAAGAGYAGVYRFDASSGTASYYLNLPLYSDWTPAVADDKLFVYGSIGAGNPGLIALDAESGDTVFAVADPSLSFGATPVVASSGYVLSIGNDRLAAVDIVKRQLAWQQPARIYEELPSVANGVVYSIREHGIEARSVGDGSALWIWWPPEPQPQHELLVTRNLLFVNTPTRTYALDLATHHPVWSYPGDGVLSLSKLGLLLISRASGELVAIAVK